MSEKLTAEERAMLADFLAVPHNEDFDRNVVAVFLKHCRRVQAERDKALAAARELRSRLTTEVQPVDGRGGQRIMKTLSDTAWLDEADK